jgi:hypothetical protein
LATTFATPIAITSPATILNGSAVVAAPVAQMVSGTGANNSGGVGRELSTGFNSGTVRIDGFPSDLSADGYAANGCFAQTLAASGTVTVDYTNVVGATTSAAGDNLATLLNKLIINNYGTTDITVAPGASNPIVGILAGTTPTLKIPAGSKVRLESVAGFTVSGTAKTLLFTNLSSTVAAAFAVAHGGV